MQVHSKSRYHFGKATRPPAIAVLWLILFFLVGASFPFAQDEDEEDLNVFWKWVKFNDSGSFLIDHLIRQAEHLYDLRDKEIAELETRQDWLRRQKWVRAKLDQLLGPLPEKTPLNPRITGVLQKDGFRIEKLVYESMPGFYVAGCLFIPNGVSDKAPAILNVFGHNQEAFRAELYQRVYLNLVKKGFIVLAIDPLGQGEAVQYFDPKLEFSAVGYTVLEHCYFGNICFLTGVSPGRYFAWDGIRGIDYLLTRDDVDPARIGVTGFSGGGTVTSYISALDDRVEVSIPCSWPVASRRQTETKGTQDAENVFVHGLAEGITFEDLVEVRAPKPTLMTFTSRDEYLSIQGAREAYSEARKAYRAFGEEENIQLVEDDFRHWLTPKIRAAIYAFFMEHLGVSGDPTEEEVEILSEEELRVTPTGQISTWLDAENVFSMNKKEAESLIERLESSRQDLDRHLVEVRARAREISGFKMPADDNGDPLFNGRYQRDGYSVGKYAIRGEGNYRIPLLLFVPDESRMKYAAVLYLHPKGKATEAGPGGEIEGLVKKGYVVAAADILGTGETENRATRVIADDYTAILIGRSLPGIQAGDIVRLVNYLQDLDGLKIERIGAVGIDEMGIPLMHAAAFEPSIENLTLVNTPVSYRSIVTNVMFKLGLIEREGGNYWHPHEVDFAWGVAGALKAYDLPDLIGCVAPRRVSLLGLRDQLLEPASEELTDRDMSFPRAVYARMNVSENLKIVPAHDLGSLIDWCFE